MLIEIIKHTPPWVFILFLVLVWFGYFQSKDRIVSKNRVCLLPLAMIALSFYGVISAFGNTTAGLVSWLAGAVGATFPGLLFVAPRGVLYSRKNNSFFIPGSLLPLILMMAIFFTKYAVGAVLARHLPIANKPEFIVTISLLYGFFSGLFFARSVAIWRCANISACLSPDLPDCRTSAAASGNKPTLNNVRSVLGYTWAILAFFIVLATFIGNKAFSAKLAKSTGVTVSPWYTGGEATTTIEHNSYRTIIHRPVFDGLLSDRKNGFVQIDWESPNALPAIIDENVVLGTDKNMAFKIRFETETGKAVVTSDNSSVLGVEKCIRLKNGWVVRVLLRKI